MMNVQLVVQEIPLAVHRAFTRGSSWAYHPSLEPELREIAVLTSGVIDSLGPETAIIPYGGGSLICVTLADPNCLDRLAKDRNPSIFVVGFCREMPSDCERLALQNGLSSIELPSRSGTNSDLKVRLKHASKAESELATADFDHDYSEIEEVDDSIYCECLTLPNSSDAPLVTKLDRSNRKLSRAITAGRSFRRLAIGSSIGNVCFVVLIWIGALVGLASSAGIRIGLAIVFTLAVILQCSLLADCGKIPEGRNQQ